MLGLRMGAFNGCLMVIDLLELSGLLQAFAQQTALASAPVGAR
jgi:hypothetical protein